MMGVDKGAKPPYLLVSRPYQNIICSKMERKPKKTKKEAKEFNDVNCPIHGSLSTRGAVLEGVVASDKMNKTVIVQSDYKIRLKKYERYRSSKSRIPAHNPPCIDAKVGDRVRIRECRKLSKTVSFVVTDKLD